MIIDGKEVPVGAPYECRVNCDHNIPLLSGECVDCTGPMTETELDMIRKRLVGHDVCYPKCDRAPSSETARLIATVDKWKFLASAQASELEAARAEIDATANPKPTEWLPAPGIHGTVLYQADGVLVGHLALDPGAEVPRESHDGQMEHITLLKGALRVVVEHQGRDWHIRMTSDGMTDAHAAVRAGYPRSISNASATEPAEYIAILRRA